MGTGDLEVTSESQAPLPTYAVPPPRERGEMLYVFRQEIQSLRLTVERWRNPPASEFMNASFALLGIAGGAGIALIAYYSEKPPRSGSEATLLWVLVIAGALSSACCFLAARALSRSQRTTREQLLDDLRRIEYESPIAGDLGGTSDEEVGEELQTVSET